MVMQMHYYNPTMVEDVYDSSGVRIHLTKEIRPIDAGLMDFAVGVSAGMSFHLQTHAPWKVYDYVPSLMLYC